MPPATSTRPSGSRADDGDVRALPIGATALKEPSILAPPASPPPLPQARRGLTATTVWQRGGPIRADAGCRSSTRSRHLRSDIDGRAMDYRVLLAKWPR